MAWTMTAQDWRRISREGKFWRSSQFNAIETAVGAYNPAGTDDARLSGLKAILDAISAWRVYKQEAKAKKQGVAFASPRTARDTGDKIAAAETRLQEIGVIGGEHETLSVRSRATERLVRDVVEEIDVVLNASRSAWGGAAFTDPAHHVADNFRYLVSAQTETKAVMEFRERTINNPRLIADALISASVITHDSIHIWGPSGFILAAPTNCIGVAKADDFATRNAVAEGHQLEKYREILRLYESGVRLPAPTTLRAPANKHTEVAVLGRSYGQTTEVVGIFVIVDQAADRVSEIRPAKVYRIAATLTRKGTTEQTQVIEETLPCVTGRRMDQFRLLHVEQGLPIVQILLTDAVEIGASYWSGLYDGTVMFPRPRRSMIHGSPEHLEAIRSAAFNVTVKDGHPADCGLCAPPPPTRARSGAVSD